ncbi:MAG: histidine phosphatase family protein [Acidimicrobiia bacterium]|nr:histidine phosphatase family protein [Acidimicrobiia bacterium]
MAALVHLVRHAEVHNPDHVVYGRLPHYGLSDRGRRQAADAGRYMASRAVVAVWSSPLQRALETGAAIAAPHQLPVRVHEGLSEWRLADAWEGLAWDDLPTLRPGELETYLSRPWDLPFSDESLDELTDRMMETLRELNDRHPEGDIVVVSHQDPVQVVRLELSGKAPVLLHTDKPQHATVYSLRPGSSWSEAASYTPPEQDSFPPLDTA